MTQTYEVTQVGGGTYPMMTLIAPNGVTRMAGANVYAAKLATIQISASPSLRIRS